MDVVDGDGGVSGENCKGGNGNRSSTKSYFLFAGCSGCCGRCGRCGGESCAGGLRRCCCESSLIEVRKDDDNFFSEAS